MISQHERLLAAIQDETSPVIKGFLRWTLEASFADVELPIRGRLLGAHEMAILSIRNTMKLSGIDPDELLEEKREMAGLSPAPQAPKEPPPPTAPRRR